MTTFIPKDVLTQIVKHLCVKDITMWSACCKRMRKFFSHLQSQQLQEEFSGEILSFYDILPTPFQIYHVLTHMKKLTFFFNTSGVMYTEGGLLCTCMRGYHSNVLTNLPLSFKLSPVFFFEYEILGYISIPDNRPPRLWLGITFSENQYTKCLCERGVGVGWVPGSNHVEIRYEEERERMQTVSVDEGLSVGNFVGVKISQKQITFYRNRKEFVVVPVDLPSTEIWPCVENS